MLENKISVIIPTYNSESTLLNVIRSCLNQTLPPTEILVCDDGSTDNSKNVVDQIGNSNIIWIPSKHFGTPAIPRNNGIKHAKGEWIAFCDSDDEWLPNKLENQLALTKKLGCKASCTNAFIKKGGSITPNRLSDWSNKIIAFKNLLKNNYIICSSAMIHNSIMRKMSGFPEETQYAGFEDYIYWLRIGTITNFAFLNESLVIYDDHPETSLRSTFKDGKLLKEIVFADFIRWARINKLYWYIYQVRIHVLSEWLKSMLRDIIKLCLKK